VLAGGKYGLVCVSLLTFYHPSGDLNKLLTMLSLCCVVCLFVVVPVVLRFSPLLLHPCYVCKVLPVDEYVCLSARITRKPHGQNYTKLLYMLPMAVAWSSRGFAVCFVDDIMYSQNGSVVHHVYS